MSDRAPSSSASRLAPPAMVSVTYSLLTASFAFTRTQATFPQCGGMQHAAGPDLSKSAANQSERRSRGRRLAIGAAIIKASAGVAQW